MQITYENTFDHWVATQLFNMESPDSLKFIKRQKLQCYLFIVFLIVIDVAAIYTHGFDFFFFAFTLFIIFLTSSHLRYSHKNMQAGMYRDLKIIYGPRFEEGRDKTIQWEVMPEHLVILDSDKETRLTPSGIQNITVCPQYLFLHSGLELFKIPRQAVTEVDFTTFCDHLINWYHTNTQQNQSDASIIRSNWTLELSPGEMSALSKQAASMSSKIKFSFIKIILTILLGILFLIGGIIIFGALKTAIKLI